MLILNETARILRFAAARLNDVVDLDRHLQWSGVTKPRRRIKWSPPLDLGGREGGAFVLAENRGPIVLQAYLGVVPDEKRAKYWMLAAEKASRLNTNHDLSSWQSRDGKEKWGGAIRSREYIFSFSGLPELWDEAFMLLVAFDSSSMDSDIADEIARKSSNPHWPVLKEAFHL